MISSMFLPDDQQENETLTSTEGSQADESQQISSISESNGVGRQFGEALCCLAIAVLLFRTFALEGYIISTGSMAPCLYGYHKRVECPDCGFRFAQGVAFDRDVTTNHIARCPNCLQSQIDVSEVPRNDGDQLLVFKHAYAFRDPKRWEVVVFLNPASPSQAYVKRVVGLPGESIQVVNGDVQINGQLQRKSLETQRSMRIPVFDNDFPATESDWLPHWIADAGWGSTGGRFLRSVSDPDSFCWVSFQNWPRGIGSTSRNHTSRQLVSPRPISDIYGYNRIFGMDDEHPVRDLMLECRVSMPKSGSFAVELRAEERLILAELDADSMKSRVWIVRSEHERNRALNHEVEPLAVADLREEWVSTDLHFELSNFDQQLLLALNGQTTITHEILPVLKPSVAPRKAQRQRSKESRARRDELVRSPEGASAFDDVQLPRASVPARADVQIAGYSDGNSHRETAPDLSPEFGGDETSREFSEASRSRLGLSSSPVRFGSTNGAFQVHSIRLFRDVHYVSEPGQHAVDRPHQLADDEFFFLGDNSPVSLDSRGWIDPAVPRSLLVGRPLTVHLPSKPVGLKIGDSVKHIRLPDWERIRCIR